MEVRVGEGGGGHRGRGRPRIHGPRETSGVTLHSQEREFVYFLREFFKQEEENMLLHNESLIPFNQVRKRTVCALKIGERSILRISLSGPSLIVIPGKERPRAPPVTQLDSFQLDTLRGHKDTVNSNYFTLLRTYLCSEDLTVNTNSKNCEMDVKAEVKEETSNVALNNVKDLDSSALEKEESDKLSVSSEECEMPVKVEVKEEPWWPEKEAETSSVSDEKKIGVDETSSRAESPRCYTEEHTDDSHDNDTREISYAEWAVAMLGAEPSDECEQNGNSAFYLKTQGGRKKGKKQHICKICGKQFTQTPNLKMHYLIHEGKRPHTCNICGKTFTKRSTMKAHTLIHEGKKPYKCDTCEKSFTTRSNLKAHKLLHEDRTPPKCDICDMSFPSKSAMKRHNLIHEGKCKICEKVFTESSHLIAHAATHEDEKPHKCYICEESFRKRSDLKIHILIHEGKNLHKCDICGKLFTKRYYLKIHYMVHEGKRPHKCNVCERSFTAISNLRAHKVIHEGIKPHKCEICNKRFAVKPTLKRHYMTHEEIKCDICDQKFPAKSALKLHYLSHEERSPQNCEILRRALLGDQT